MRVLGGGQNGAPQASTGGRDGTDGSAATSQSAGAAGTEPTTEVGSGGAAPAGGGSDTGGIPAIGGTAGEPATGGTATGGTATGGSASACLEPGQDCSLNVDGCCPDSACIADFAHDLIVCASICEVDAECLSGCCMNLGNTETRVCAPADACVGDCIAAGEDCSLDVLGCCFGSTCVTNALGTYCAAICAADWQCASGCCAPLSNAPFWVCSPVQFCS